MALLPYGKLLLKLTNFSPRNNLVLKRTLMSKQLVFSEFGDPLSVVKFREDIVPPVGNQEVLVRMLAAPVNPADINTIQGRHSRLPILPHIAGDEGIGQVIEVGKHVCTCAAGDRVVLTSRQLGTWRYFGVYNQRDVHVVGPVVPLPEASMLTVSPSTAYRMIKDYKHICPGQTVAQNAANSPIGQCVIQICKAMGINTFNIVANRCGFEAVKEYLLSIGATAVHTLEEAEELSTFNTSLDRPTLALNCLGGRFEDVMLKLIELNGDIVYHGCAYDLPLVKQRCRRDVRFHKFRITDWYDYATNVEKNVMLQDIIKLVVTGQFKGPLYEPIVLKNYYVTQVQDVKEPLEGEQHCTMLDVAPQQFYVDIDSTTEMIVSVIRPDKKPVRPIKKDRRESDLVAIAESVQRSILTGTDDAGDDQLDTIFRKCFEDSTANYSADDVTFAGNIIKELQRLPAVKPSIANRNMLVTRVSVNETESSTIESPPTLVTGTVQTVQEGCRFLYKPELYLIAKKELSQESSADGIDHNFLHMHVHEIQQNGKVVRTAVTLNKRHSSNGRRKADY
ncbi:hypothetical protein MSG28_013210 [Choristoneura fumiferana]|uniref:Uncharacterized protein n=1 Tax=Choristoneura fumiferana TaxID=7141 RepID=A0ACC0KSG9_CHOFU|nr:hypothetical protein MSG28_013210 [Choristoneura fumiferana]